MAPSVATLPLVNTTTPRWTQTSALKSTQTTSITYLEIPHHEEQKLERHLPIPLPASERLQKARIDISNGYPEYPRKLTWLEDAIALEPKDREYVDPGSRADPDKKALFGAAKQVKHLTKHIGTEITGLQLKVFQICYNCRETASN